MALTVTSTDLDTLLGLGGTIDTGRATLLLGLATDLCTAVINPVPDNARAVVLSMAARAYVNPSGVQSQTVGPASMAFSSAVPGLYMSKGDVSTLRLLAGQGGAFTINPTPTDAGQNLPSWDQNIWLEDGGYVREGESTFFESDVSEDVGLP